MDYELFKLFTGLADAFLSQHKSAESPSNAAPEVDWGAYAPQVYNLPEGLQVRYYLLHFFC